jgi:hypothetical protein
MNESAAHFRLRRYTVSGKAAAISENQAFLYAHRDGCADPKSWFAGGMETQKDGNTSKRQAHT